MLPPRSMKTLFLVCLNLVCAIVLRADMIRFTFTDPGADWAKPGFVDEDWTAAKDFAEVSARWIAANDAAVWVRLHQDMTWEQINNSYFRVAHDGKMEIFVNGKRKDHDDAPSPAPKGYPISPGRDEVVGANVFGLHFTHGNAARSLGIEHVIGEWVPVGERIVKSNPIFPEPTRDAQVCRGPDGDFYLAATSGDRDFFFGPKYWLLNPGVMLRHSADLKTWTNMGWVWTFDHDGTWNKDIGAIAGRGPARGIFAPEISYFKNQYWLPYSVNHTTARHTFGIGLLHADKPEGPWQEMSPDQPFSEGFDPSLFHDEDGKVYLLRNRSLIARVKDDMSGLAEPYRQLAASNFPCVGYEGPCMFKANGRYYLAAAEWFLHPDGKKSYDVAVASSDHVYGPYGPRHLAVRYGGHNGFFQDKNGQWYATVWSLPDSDHQITIARVEITPDGIVRPMLEDCQQPAVPGSR